MLPRRRGRLGGGQKEPRHADRLRNCPGTDAAARRGDLSAEQAAAIASAVAANPSAEADLLDKAKRLSLDELEAECARVKAAATDPEERRKKIHANRSVRSWTDGEGAGHIHARGTPEAVAQIMARIDAERDRVFAQARRCGKHERPDAYGFDALRRICAGEATDAKVTTKIIGRVDLDTLLRGYAIDGEVCEVAGVPVAPSAIADLLATGSAFLAAVVTKGERLAGVVHFGRAPTAKQQTGLEWLYPTCAVEGCGQAAHLQRDHRVEWAATKVTVFDLLDLLCPFHHRLKTVDGWKLVDGHGKRAFVPKSEPRHPQHAPPQHAPPSAAA